MKARIESMLLGLALLAGCGSGEAPGGLSAEEARELANAAAMLEDNMVDTSADSLTANEAALNALDEGAGNAADADPELPPVNHQ